MFVALALVLLSFSFPHLGYAFNGYLEDCDFDAYDDETHAPVPWYGFDETKGDVVPADWDGVAGSYVFKAPPASTDAPDNTANSPAADSPPSNSTQGNAAVVSPDDSTNNAEAAEALEAAGPEGSTEAAIANTPTPLASLSPAAAAIVAVKGTLDVAPQSGAVYAPGSEVIIKGDGFAGSVEELDLRLGSENPQALAKVSTTVDGAFEATVKLPERLEPGKHDIIVYYEDSPIVKRTIDVVEAAPGSAPAGDSLFVGSILLASLAIVGAGALLGWRVTKKKRLSDRAKA
jgi:hypothetical protein